MRKRMNSLGPGWTFALSHYQIKRLVLEQRSLGEVLRLMRIAIGPLALGTLAKGAWRHLTATEVQALTSKH